MYSTDDGALSPATTYDVDCVIDMTTCSGEKDFEDIVFVLNNCSSIIDKVQQTADSDVMLYLQACSSEMLRRPNIREEIDSAILKEGRSDIVLAATKAMTNLV